MAHSARRVSESKSNTQKSNVYDDVSNNQTRGVWKSRRGPIDLNQGKITLNIIQDMIHEK